MSLDFSKIEDRQVGYHLTNGVSKVVTGSPLYGQKPVMFGDFIAFYCEGKSSRWEVYSALVKDLSDLNSAFNAISGAQSRINLEDIATLALRKDVVRNAMDLIVREYLSKGNIDNSPHYSNL